jgi:hypothetical protein
MKATYSKNIDNHPWHHKDTPDNLETSQLALNMARSWKSWDEVPQDMKDVCVSKLLRASEKEISTAVRVDSHPERKVDAMWMRYIAIVLQLGSDRLAGKS